MDGDEVTSVWETNTGVVDWPSQITNEKETFDNTLDDMADGAVSLLQLVPSMPPEMARNTSTNLITSKCLSNK